MLRGHPNFSPTKLRELRKRRGFTQVSLAMSLGFHKWACSDWERGKHAPTWVNLVAIANALDCEPEDLLDEQPASAADQTTEAGHQEVAARGGDSYAD
jgi:transcriptional regulator with XRE-family HTH domain